MAKLVQKSGYIKSEKAGGYMKYIATREGVEKLTGNGPATKGQRELIQKLLHDFPDAVELFEYEDYRKAPTIVHQMIECVKVYPDGRLDIIFGGGYLIEEHLEEEIQ